MERSRLSAHPCGMTPILLVLLSLHPAAWGTEVRRQARPPLEAAIQNAFVAASLDPLAREADDARKNASLEALARRYGAFVAGFYGLSPEALEAEVRSLGEEAGIDSAKTQLLVARYRERYQSKGMRLNPDEVRRHSWMAPEAGGETLADSVQSKGELLRDVLNDPKPVYERRTLESWEALQRLRREPPAGTWTGRAAGLARQGETAAALVIDAVGEGATRENVSFIRNVYDWTAVGWLHLRLIEASAHPTLGHLGLVALAAIPGIRAVTDIVPAPAALMHLAPLAHRAGAALAHSLGKFGHGAEQAPRAVLVDSIALQADVVAKPILDEREAREGTAPRATPAQQAHLSLSVLDALGAAERVSRAHADASTTR